MRILKINNYTGNYNIAIVAMFPVWNVFHFDQRIDRYFCELGNHIIIVENFKESFYKRWVSWEIPRDEATWAKVMYNSYRNLDKSDYPVNVFESTEQNPLTLEYILEYYPTLKMEARL